MTENKRFIYIKNSSITQYQSIPIQKIGKGKPFHCQGLVDELNNLSEENEQLQFELKECNDNRRFSRRELKKENERIKHMIQEAYNNERTQIGKSVLKQLMEQIQ